MSVEQPTIAVVEDDVEMGTAIARLLSAAGYRAVTYSSGEAMLVDDAAVHADFFVLDVHLPGISGFELRERILQRGATGPAAFVTGSDDISLARSASDSGAVCLLRKPFGCAALLAAIEGALGEPHARS